MQLGGDPLTKDYNYEHFRQVKLFYDTASLVAEQGAALRKLRGQRLRAVHAQWEDRNFSDSGWWNNGPVIFTFENAQLELFASKGGFSVAMDAYDLDVEDTIGEPEDETYVIWRANPWAELQPVLQHPLQSVRAIEASYEDSKPRVMGITLEFEEITVCLYEGGDQMSLTWGALPDDATLHWQVGLIF